MVALVHRAVVLVTPHVIVPRHLLHALAVQIPAVVDVQEAAHPPVAVAVRVPQNRPHAQVVQVHVAEVALEDVQEDVQEDALVAVQVAAQVVVAQGVVHLALENVKGSVPVSVPQVVIVAIVAEVAAEVVQAHVLVPVYNTVLADATIHVKILVLAHVKPTVVWVHVREYHISDKK